MIQKIVTLLSIASLCFISCSKQTGQLKTAMPEQKMSLQAQPGEAVATFSAGCFWCMEEIFEDITGTRDVISGYAGGKAEDADYEKVSSGHTDHAETIQIYYDPAVISFEQLTEAFFASLDPTTLNQQGPDIGTQYRSIAFYRNDQEKEIILDMIHRIDSSGIYKKKIVTEVKPFTAFYPAEDYHQNYIVNHPDNPYVKGVSIPRYEEFKKKYKGRLKNN
ncbi:MAG: peptide-methionine (S)-S-oxide reductase MsrA [Saprospiraceae bacterium]